VKQAVEVSSQFPEQLSDYAPSIHAMVGLLFLSVGEPVYSIAHLQLALEVLYSPISTNCY